jgi:hypothetical protein
MQVQSPISTHSWLILEKVNDQLLFFAFSRSSFFLLYSKLLLLSDHGLNAVVHVLHKGYL